MAFWDNITGGATSMIAILTTVGQLFTTEPYNLIIIGAVTVLGFKMAMKAITKVKKA